MGNNYLSKFNITRKKGGCKMIGIYKITNKLTNKAYVGQSTDIARRFKEHCIPLDSDILTFGS